MSQNKDTNRRNTSSLHKQIAELDSEIEKHIGELERAMDASACFPFLDVQIEESVVDDVFDTLRTTYRDRAGRLIVIVDSGGGDIHAAYNLAMLFRRYGHESLIFVVPRWAKSAATLLVCGGDQILMTPVAELGPLDPQITEFNPLDRRFERFSPLHIESTLEMIRQEYERGSEKLARALMERLQFPLTLGSFKKSLEIGKQYLVKLLQTRMLQSQPDEAARVATMLAEGYTDHAFCINVEEARSLGLLAKEVPEEALDLVWNVYRLHRKRRELERVLREDLVMKRISELPPDLLDKLLPSLKETPVEHGDLGSVEVGG